LTKIDEYHQFISINKNYEVLDDGFVRLDNSMGGDLSVVNHARISLDVQKEKIDESDKKLIRYLMKQGHGSVYESIWFSFHIRAPIFVARQWMRHRIAGYNEISGRYVEMKDKFYTPKDEFVRTQIGKRGDYQFEEIADRADRETIDYIYKIHYDNSVKAYQHLMELGVAKELARIVLPLALYTEFFFDVNARSLMNFLMQRNHPHAQAEMREYAKVLENIFAEIAPITYNAFIENGRVAP